MLLPRDALDNRPRRIRARAVAAIAVSSAWRLTLSYYQKLWIETA
jgi:hypothetical protein